MMVDSQGFACQIYIKDKQDRIDVYQAQKLDLNIYQQQIAQIIFLMPQQGKNFNDDEQIQNLKSSSFSSRNLPTNTTNQFTHFKVILMCLLSLFLLAAVVVLYSNNQSFRNSKLSVMKLLTDRQSSQQFAKESLDNHNAKELKQPSLQLQSIRSNKFQIPKKLWIFIEDPKKQNIFVNKCIQNIERYSKESTFEISLINQQNFKGWISQKSQEVISSVLTDLYGRKQKRIKDNLRNIKQKLISFYVLHQNGGILVDKNIILTENFTWIEQIASNPYVNRGNHSSTPQYFAFHDINHGSRLEPINKGYSIHEYEQYMILFPGIQTFFIVAIPEGEYLSRVLEEYCKILKDENYLDSVAHTFQLKMGKLQVKDIYTNGITIASHIALTIKQFEISKRFKEGSTVNEFAIDYYGLVTINSRYFPRKASYIFDHNFQEKVYQNLAAYTLQQFEQTVGPLRYMVLTLFQPYLNNRLEELINMNKNPIHPQSFLAKYLFFSTKRHEKQWFLSEIEKPIENKNAPRWESLPKIVWLFWTSGFKKTSSGNKLCIQNLIRAAEKSGFQVREVNNTNVESYIGKQLNERFDNVIKNHQIPVFPPTKSNMIRKAIIAKYGGIYLDVSYISLESFDWILNIAQYPSQYIFNRYGQLPRVLMFFHPHYGQPFTWNYNPKANTKNMQLVAYQNNLIIAQPNQQLLKEWIDEYTLVISSPYSQTKKRMEEYHVKDHSWTNDKDLYLTSMDSLKNVIGRKQNELNKKAQSKDYTGPRSAAEYYGIWSMSGYRGQQKIRMHTNFDNSYYYNPQSSNNVFLYRYSIEYTEGILGKANQVIKLYNWSLRHLTELIEEEYEYNFTRKIHPHSYCMKYLIAPLQSKIIKRVEQLHINDV